MSPRSCGLQPIETAMTLYAGALREASRFVSSDLRQKPLTQGNERITAMAPLATNCAGPVIANFPHFCSVCFDEYSEIRRLK
jgi:hypothetical protein